jgi:hypothetical protein
MARWTHQTCCMVCGIEGCWTIRSPCMSEQRPQRAQGRPYTLQLEDWKVLAIKLPFKEVVAINFRNLSLFQISHILHGIFTCKTGSNVRSTLVMSIKKPPASVLERQQFCQAEGLAERTCFYYYININILYHMIVNDIYSKWHYPIISYKKYIH